MADKRKNVNRAPAADSRRPAVATDAKRPAVSKLEELPILRHAVEDFIRDNTTIESSFPINAALEEMDQCSDAMALFTLPLQRQLFGVDAALRWLLFLSLAPDRATSEGEAALAPFPITKALSLIAEVYDVGVQHIVWEHFEEDEEDGDESDNSEGASK